MPQLRGFMRKSQESGFQVRQADRRTVYRPIDGLRIHYIGNGGPGRWAGAVADHEEMSSALEVRDAGRLSRVLTTHIEQAWERVRSSI